MGQDKDIPAASTVAVTNKELKDEAGADKSQNSSATEEYIILPKPRPFTRAKVNSVERRPAAVLPFCKFLYSLASKCKADLIKMGCATHTQGHATSDKSSTSVKRLRHGDREPWVNRMKRLKVYQRAFSAIVMHFKAYSPVLLHIKKTYEDMLSYRINQIKLAHFERKRLHIKKQRMRQQMNDYQFPEYPRLLKSEKYLSLLRQRITLQEEAIKCITGILTRMEDALSDHFERHRDLEEQIIMVDTEITNRRQKAFSMREKEERDQKEKETANRNNDDTISYVDSDEEDAKDPFYNVEDVDEDRRMVWIMAFAICHKDLEDAERKINLYQTKYQYVVPRHQIEDMKSSKTDEKISANQLQNEKRALENELTSLKSTEEKMAEELKHVKTQLTELRTTVTPRPSWEQLGEFILGGVPKWEKMIQGKSTKEVTDKLFGELRSRRSGDKYINPLGVEHSVLRCLRYGKKVYDRQLHSRDACLLIHDIWMERKAALLENLNSPKKDQGEFDFVKGANLATKSFPDFVAIYFENMYEDVEQRMEWTYNLVECCKRFSLEYRLTQFLNVLQSKIDEGIYTAVSHEMFRIRNALLERSVDEGMNSGMLSSNQYVEALEAIFPNKPDSEMQSLVRVTNKLNAERNPEANADLSMYRVPQLIDMRDDGFRGALVSELVKQFEQGRLAFIESIILELAMIIDVNPAAASKESDPVGDRDISVVQVYVAINRADSSLDDTHAGAASPGSSPQPVSSPAAGSPPPDSSTTAGFTDKVQPMRGPPAWTPAPSKWTTKSLNEPSRT